MTQLQYLDESEVELVDIAGNDLSVVQAARVCATDDKNTEGAEQLIEYLLKQRHGTPFEHNLLKFRIEAPIFVWREFHRHRIGFCLAGDTKIYTESYAQGSGRTLRKRSIKDLCEIWNNGVKDSIGRVRFLPSVRNQKLRVLNEKTNLFELGSIENIFESGIKECLLLEVEHKKEHSLRCSKDHPILTSEGWIKAGELNGTELIAVSGKRNASEGSLMPPSLRRGIGVWTSMQRNRLIPVKGAKCYFCEFHFPREQLELDHLVPVVYDLKKALDIKNLKPVCIQCHRDKTDTEQIFANREVVAGSKFVPLKRKPFIISEEMTYDITMKGEWKNFVANGIVVHNSYNEESARYKTLEPKFYLPPADRPMVKVVEWKPGRPKFVQCVDSSLYLSLINNLKESYELSYANYEKNLAMNFDPGLARDCLPVGIFSTCYVSCNARSLMSFLSLRTHEPKAEKVSYPLFEIEQVARKMESIFSRYFPATHTAFCKFGRTAP